jgi:hypothetical protein
MGHEVIAQRARRQILMKQIIIILTLVTLLVVAMVLAQATDLSTASTPLTEAYAAPTPSGETVTREPFPSYEPTEPANRTPSPYGTEPAG